MSTRQVCMKLLFGIVVDEIIVRLALKVVRLLMHFLFVEEFED